MRADVLLQHARLLAADATFLADVLPPAATADVNIVLVGFIPAGENEGHRLYGDVIYLYIPMLCVE